MSVGTLTGSGNSGSITLDNASNQFTDIGALSTTTGGIAINDNTGSLNIAGAVNGGTGAVKLKTVGNISQTAAVSTTSTGDAVVLVAGGNYSNTAGVAAISAGSGRWVVYSTNPASNTFGGLASGNAAVYNTTHAGTPPSGIAAGNRYVFSFQPTANITANAQTRVYDRTATF